VTQSLADLFAQKFIARRDVKAVQHSDGSYAPTRGEPWKRADIEAHLAGERTYGHYLLDTDDTVKLFCIDVDLREKGTVSLDWNIPDAECTVHAETDLRRQWRDRRSQHRPFLKYSMHYVAHIIGHRIWTELEIPFAVAYSGNKGIHIYGFTGRVPAADAREGALIAMESTGLFKLERGDSMYKFGGDISPSSDADDCALAAFSYEVYPKQSSLAGKDLGNLLRLPLGRNQKSKDPTFFMDMTSALVDMVPVDPIFALTTDNPWKRPGE
jgi:hypothetical protein